MTKLFLLFLILVSAAAAMAPPMPPRPVGTALSSPPAPKLVVDMFHDLMCPFSCRMYKRVVEEVRPALEASNPGEVKFVYHNVPQVWHPQSCTAHLAFFAVRQTAGPEQALAFAHRFCDARESFGDAEVLDKTTNEVYAELAAVAAAGGGGVDADAVLAALRGGAAVQDLKFAAKYHRRLGVHVTPTVFFNGIEAPHISSSFTAEEWKENVAEFL
mmetsp:Transcript_34392/g.62798  ORF Transcript_34392/g.62798 Transcript_34392/m.62798 type:complete len:215 (-) Transcript_34392:312-956(-)